MSPTFATALASLRPSWRETLHARVRPTLFSIAVFSCMLALSGVTLLRYALPGWSAAQAGDEARPAAARQAPRPVRDTAASAPQPRVLEAGEQPAEPPEPSAASAQAPAEEIQSLLRQGDRALLRRNPHEAQQAFERILELDQINARAADGLARVRLAQGDLNGAESWIRVAIKRRPRRAAYHALYAEILATLGREEEALEERLKAASGLTQPAESEPDQREE